MARLRCDSYKYSQYKQYPAGTERISAYFESRGGGLGQNVTVFGMQGFLKEYLVHPNIEMPTQLSDRMAAHFGSRTIFNEEGFRRLWLKHGNKLPVSIKAVPEGSVVPKKNVLYTIENTDPEFFWLTNWLETLMVRAGWYGSTVATTSREMKLMMLRQLRWSGDESLVGFKLHDFGMRGVSSGQSAAIGGAGHLVNFLGTDTDDALDYVADFYGDKMAGFSIPAAEHSTITSWGRDNEKQAYENMLDQFQETPVAVVSDSWDIYNACEHIWGGALRDKVLARDPSKFVVIRPDSGEPTVVVQRCLDILGSKFGFSVNSKGFKVLNPRVRMIQGDGISSVEHGKRVYDALAEAGWSADNLALGMGGGLLQKCDRDTMKFAQKVNYVEGTNPDGTEFSRDVYKDPITDPGKQSKKGKVKLVEAVDENGHPSFVTVPLSDPRPTVLVEVYRNGMLMVDEQFSKIRERASVKDWEI